MEPQDIQNNMQPNKPDMNKSDIKAEARQAGLFKMFGALVAIIVAGFGFWKMKGGEPALQPVDFTTSTPPITPDVTSSSTTSHVYKDGTYTATGTYSSPAGTEHVEITLTIQNDTVATGSFVGKAQNPTSKKMQALFSEGFNSYVVGKKVDDITLKAVNGSSLTPKGFMDALTQIKVEAKA